jgi:NCAIR mutase (PurE)-related protein
MENRDLRIDFSPLQPVMPQPSLLLELVSRFTAGQITGDEFRRSVQSLQGDSIQHGLDQIAADATFRVPGATVDLGRQTRCGFGEVIYGEGKSPELLTNIVRTQLDAGQSSLITRVDSDTACQVQRSFQFSHHNPVARTLSIAASAALSPSPLTTEQASRRIHAAVVTAGSTDAPVAEEAIETLHWMGVGVQRFDDIGVAGPQRLVAALPRLRLASAIVVVAGMEGALPAVLGGHVAVPIFAVPTSVGYGANLGGLTTLLSMLSTCAAGVAVVNIDAGFKGGYLAGMVIRQLENFSRQNGDGIA